MNEVSLCDSTSCIKYESGHLHMYVNLLVGLHLQKMLFVYPTQAL